VHFRWLCREFIEDKLPALRQALKGVKCDVQMKANKHPVMRAEYGELTAASAHVHPPHPATRPALEAVAAWSRCVVRMGSLHSPSPSHRAPKRVPIA